MRWRERWSDERLAACVHVQAPISSTYRWKGAVERETERQLVIKTTRARLHDLEARLRALHPYELPEFVVLSAEAGDGLRPLGQRRRRLVTSSNTIGSTDTKTMPIVTSEKLSFTIGTLPNSKPAPRHRPTQRDRADGVVEDERRGRHLRRAGDERHERPHDRHEPAEDDRLAAVLLEERVGALQVFAGSAAGASPATS